MKNLLVAQSGGPTAAINATLCGVIEEGIANNKIQKVYGAKHGILGILSDELIELNEQFTNLESLQLLCQTPSAALGSCRKKLENWLENEAEYDKILAVFQKYNIGCFIYIGGNDSMDTVYKLSEYCKVKNISDIQIMGAPKTIDNDLCETDHCPGFGSAAKYIATTFSEISCDCDVYAVPAVTIVEVMGRDAGWLTATSGLARINGNTAPDLIYLCEKPFSTERFLKDVKNKLKVKSAVVVAVSEGVSDENGNYIADSLQNSCEDAFGHKILAGAGGYLEEVVRQEIGCKVRSIELNLMQRCASHVASLTDINEAKLLGRATTKYAIEGGSGEMACIKRVSQNPYLTDVEFVAIDKIANKVKNVPLSWINEDGNDITKEMIEYLLPLIQGEVPGTYKEGVPLHFHFANL